MSLLDSTKFFLEEVERISGRPVVVQEDPSLQVLATVQIARGIAPMHVIRYKPIPNRKPDYHICYQCGFLLRLFENEPEYRFSLGVSPDASKKIDAWITEGPSSPQLKANRDFILSGLLTQLRSIPIGLRIDNLIWERHEDLREEQLASARLQLSQNVQVLAPALRKSFPRKLLRANTTMNAAFAIFWSEKMGDPSHRLPYQSVGADSDGEELMKVFTSIRTSSSEDWNLVDKWAEFLGLNGWYRWILHELEY
jgi:hypothetical protein